MGGGELAGYLNFTILIAFRFHTDDFPFPGVSIPRQGRGFTIAGPHWA